MLNALTVDVEDYFNASVFDSVFDRKDWSRLESRVEYSTEVVLSLLDKNNLKATFFILGWVAANHAPVVKKIKEAGHEIASHGYHHQIIYNISKESFRQDIRKAKLLLEDLTGGGVIGFRAPTYSITKKSMWAIDVLIEEGFLYDSSIFPIYHDRYGVPDGERFPHLISSDRGSLTEFPPSTVRILNRNFPIAGGAYLRILPYRYIRWGINKINLVENKPALIYFHPWEIDSGQPRLKMNLLSEFRHYTNLGKIMESKLNRLFSDFKFGPVQQVLKDLKLERTLELKYGH